MTLLGVAVVASTLALIFTLIRLRKKRQQNKSRRRREAAISRAHTSMASLPEFRASLAGVCSTRRVDAIAVDEEQVSSI